MLLSMKAIYTALICLSVSGAMAQGRPVPCDAPAIQLQVKETFYLQVLNAGRYERARRFTDPYTGSGEAFATGIKAAKPKLLAEVTLRAIVDQGYSDQLKARLCGATLVVASAEHMAIRAVYAIQRDITGASLIETKFDMLNGGGVLSDFNSLIAFFDHFYGVAFVPEQRAVASATPPASNRGVNASPVTEAQAEQQLHAAESALDKALAALAAQLPEGSRTELRADQAKWKADREKKCTPNTGSGANAGSAAALEYAIQIKCEAQATEERVNSLNGGIRLRAAHAAMDRVYQAALQQRDGDAKVRLQDQQRAWLKAREGCEGPDLLACMTDMTVKRTTELQASK